ncbi:MAG: prepilin peptidase [Anaerolineaceae bacterium]|nr:prepilin peptidase [Anaerolineaceae bacterium]
MIKIPTHLSVNIGFICGLAALIFAVYLIFKKKVKPAVEKTVIILLCAAVLLGVLLGKNALNPELLKIMRPEKGFSAIKIIAGCVILVLLGISAKHDMNTRRIPAWCSLTVMLISFILLLIERKWFAAAYLVIAVFGTGSSLFRILSILFAVITIANTPENAVPMVTGLILGDVFFATRMIGGGDAKLLFGLAAYSWNNWGMLICIAAVTIVFGIYYICKNKKGISIMPRLKEVTQNMKKGKITDDKKRLTMPFGVVLFISALLYAFVQLV